MNRLKRRDFLKSAASVGTASWLLPDFLAANVFPVTPATLASGAEGNTYAQLGYKQMILDYHFSEFNPTTLENANAAAIVDAMKALQVDSMLLYAKDHWGNCYFKTDKFKRHKNVPYDLFGEVLEGLHRNNIKVSAYYSVAQDEYSAQRTSDWFLLDKSGTPIQLQFYKNRAHPYFARWTLLCLNSPYGDYVLAELAQLIAQYDFEALFLDIVGALPLCYCHYCQALWKARYDEQLPQDLGPKEIVRYLDFQTNVIFLPFYRRVREILKANNKAIPTTHNAGLDYSLDSYLSAEIDPYGVDYYRSVETKILRANANGKEALHIGHRNNGLFDFTLKPTPSLCWEVATGVAHNCAFMFVDQPFWDGSLDPIAYSALGKAFDVADRLKPHIIGSIPYAEILILYSSRSEILNQDSETGASTDPAEWGTGERSDLHGAAKLFGDLHFPYDLATEQQVLEVDLHQYPLIVVPYSAYLAADTQKRLRDYVHAGGTLLFAYRTAQWDENANPAINPYLGLVELGEDWNNQISFVKPRINLGDTYLRVTEAARLQGHGPWDVFATLTNPGLRVTATEWISSNVIPGEDTPAPAVVTGKWGKGTFIYTSFRLFKEHLRQGLGVYRRLVERTIEPFYKPSLKVEAPRVVEAVYNRRGDEIGIVIINGITGRPTGLGNRVDIDETVPISGISVLSRTRIIDARDISGRKLNISVHGNATWRVELPKLDAYDAISLHFG